jgi:hypothetical protein
MDEQPALRERPGLRMHALALRIEALRRLGNSGEALACADELVRLDESYIPFDIDPVSVWAAAYGALADVGELARARAIATKAESWLVATSKTGVPTDARGSFARFHAASCRTMQIALPP